ncbi:membrane protein insertion efficiency factor YidD [Hyphococcus sp.]|uniref:membrane protein insertion efficiency factor YidD n=1 Tax=Hyphococcus sp. TaxID=2038636 RepID=UPI0035C694AC
MGVTDRIASGPAGRAVLGLIWLYRRTLSPALYLIGVRCRHQPTCSQYGLDAFRKHRFARAFWLTFSRVTRCHPFGSQGFDPVPEDAPRVGWKFWRLGDWSWTERTGVEQEPAKVKTER